MQLKVFTISLDMRQSLPFHPFEVTEGDTGNVLHITLQNDGEPILLNDCAVMVLFTSSMGFAMQDETSGVTIGDDPGTFTVLLDPNNYGPGIVSVDVQVYSGENHTVLITSTRFDFRCRRSLISAEIIHANVAYPPLVTATQEALDATAAALAAAAQFEANLGEMNVQADWQETSSTSDAFIRNKPLLTPYALGAAEQVHAARHATNGADAITPASIGAATAATQALTLAVADWSDNAQTVNVTGVTADNSVIVSPAAASREAYGNAGVYCSAQGTGTLTFACEDTPASALTVNALILT